jgi:hypothetical protein
LNRERLTRLRGLPSPSVLDFEAFIRTRPRSSRVRYSHPRASLPSSSFSPSGPHFPRRAPAYPALSARDVSTKNLRFRARSSSPSPASCPREARQLHLCATCLLEFSSLSSASPALETSSSHSSPREDSRPLLGCPNDDRRPETLRAAPPSGYPDDERARDLRTAFLQLPARRLGPESPHCVPVVAHGSTSAESPPRNRITARLPA